MNIILGKLDSLFSFQVFFNAPFFIVKDSEYKVLLFNVASFHSGEILLQNFSLLNPTPSSIFKSLIALSAFS
jgi:hypothetical protein